MPAESSSADTTPADSPPSIELRPPVLDDARRIAQFVAEAPFLDANSCYCYLLLCRDFADTCVVAERGEALVGFATAYRPPGRPDVLFVWQIGVSASVRRRGLGRRMLHYVLRQAGDGVRFMEATVTPDNAASRRLFQTLADELQVPCRIEAGFSAGVFGTGQHDAEDTIRLGPLHD